MIRYISIITAAGAVCKIKILVKYLFRLLRICVSLKHVYAVVQATALIRMPAALSAWSVLSQPLKYLV